MVRVMRVSEGVCGAHACYLISSICSTSTEDVFQRIVSPRCAATAIFPSPVMFVRPLRARSVVVADDDDDKISLV